eukprot:CAMPEP_0198303548 /NCGR_PEP_ID=MMETSP1449-20131203/56941_1 /TAXON_ID=420275 /ORGANISM="Attheya septentrionalis, Strain CCMP2084" /LENGTH=630 /DNA_ID=CAMNT_0044006043 /DNA_START=14 /DNA_END=1906 /DNA_ORIENTATION=+
MRKHTSRPFIMVVPPKKKKKKKNNNNTGRPSDQPLPESRRMVRVGSPVSMSWMCVYVVTMIALLLCGEASAAASSSTTVIDGRQEQGRGLAVKGDRVQFPPFFVSLLVSQFRATQDEELVVSSLSELGDMEDYMATYLKQDNVFPHGVTCTDVRFYGNKRRHRHRRRRRRTLFTQDETVTVEIPSGRALFYVTDDASPPSTADLTVQLNIAIEQKLKADGIFVSSISLEPPTVDQQQPLEEDTSEVTQDATNDADITDTEDADTTDTDVSPGLERQPLNEDDVDRDKEYSATVVTVSLVGVIGFFVAGLILRRRHRAGEMDDAGKSTNALDGTGSEDANGYNVHPMTPVTDTDEESLLSPSPRFSERRSGRRTTFVDMEGKPMPDDDVAQFDTQQIRRADNDPTTTIAMDQLRHPYDPVRSTTITSQSTFMTDASGLSRSVESFELGWTRTSANALKKDMLTSLYYSDPVDADDDDEISLLSEALEPPDRSSAATSRLTLQQRQSIQEADASTTGTTVLKPSHFRVTPPSSPTPKRGKKQSKRRALSSDTRNTNVSSGSYTPDDKWDPMDNDNDSDSPSIDSPFATFATSPPANDNDDDDSPQTRYVWHELLTSPSLVAKSRRGRSTSKR